MGEQHVSASVVNRSACALAQEIDQKLFFTLDAVLSPMRPETTELRIFVEPRHEIVCYRGDCIITAEPIVKALLLFAHLTPPASLLKLRTQRKSSRRTLGRVDRSRRTSAIVASQRG